MPTNPGPRHPQASATEQAVRGSIAYFHPIIDALVLMMAVALLLAGLPMPALAVAFVAGRLGVR